MSSTNGSSVPPAGSAGAATDPRATDGVPVKRRDFLKILGVTGAASTVVGCGTGDVERMIPYLVSPDNTVPGVSSHYASTCRECAAACGIVAEVRDGRAIKLEGNPDHPLNRGALCARGQAALQGLYNPDRFRGPMVRREGSLVHVPWDEALQLLGQRLTELRRTGSAAGAAFINQHESGSFTALLDQWLSAFGMPAHLSYDAGADFGAMEGGRASYGAAAPGLDFAAARLIVSIGADFLDGWGASVPQQLSWADARAQLRDAPRFVYIGPRRSLTGLNADEWISAKAGSELLVARALGGAGDIQAASEASSVPAERLERLRAEIAAARPSLILGGGTSGRSGELAEAVAQLNQSLGNIGTTVRADRAATGFERMGSHADLLALVQRMRDGQVPLLMVRGANPVYSLPRSAEVAEAFARVDFKVSFSSYPDETTDLCDLILPDHHPLESWGDAQAMPGVISLQQPVMEPVFDTRPTAEVLLSVARADPATAQSFTAPDWRTLLIDRFPGGRAAFAAAAQRGVAEGSVSGPAAPPRTVPVTAVAEQRQAPAAGRSDFPFDVLLYPSPVLGDGRGANKPWLQELPDPVTKICWQSWVEIHPHTAQRMNVKHGDLLRVETASGTVEAPAFVYLGIRPDTVAIALGQGHTSYGRYAEGVGINGLDLVPAAADERFGGALLGAVRGRVTRTGGSMPVVTTEGSARQRGRGIAQAMYVHELGRGHSPESHADLMGGAAPGSRPPTGAAGQTAGPIVSEPLGDRRQDEHTDAPGPEHGTDAHAALPRAPRMGVAPRRYQEGLRSPIAADAEGDIASDEAKRKGMYDPQHWSGMAQRRWAMTIDLARCTGCSACITACYAENNIPTVGALHQTRHTPGVPKMAGGNILRGREMTWLRLERYFEGGADGSDDFEARFVPMMCQHCGNAPCEPVCPVYATYQAPDGLNVQVYNRCVGTRYCSNNCPYKVRYFNWFGYGEPDRPQYAFPEPLNWQLNPDVTVRAKGVMEKCTFCVQRIRESENLASLEGRRVQADEFTTACAQACPSRAIVFGDAADPEWHVNRAIGDERAYHVFEELNTYTAVVYLKKVKHPAPGAPAHA